MAVPNQPYAPSLWRMAAYLVAACACAAERLGAGAGPIAGPTMRPPRRRSCVAGGRRSVRGIGVRGSPGQMGFPAGPPPARQIYAAAVADACVSAGRRDDVMARPVEKPAAALGAKLPAALRPKRAAGERGAACHDADILLLNSLIAAPAADEPPPAPACAVGAGRRWTARRCWVGPGHHGRGRAPAMGCPSRPRHAPPTLLAWPCRRWLGGLAGMADAELGRPGAASPDLRSAPDGVADGHRPAPGPRSGSDADGGSRRGHGLVACLGGAQILRQRAARRRRRRVHGAPSNAACRLSWTRSAAPGFSADADLGLTQTTVLSPGALATAQTRWDELERLACANVGWMGVEKSVEVLRRLAPAQNTSLVVFLPTQGLLWTGAAGPQAELLPLRTNEVFAASE